MDNKEEFTGGQGKKGKCTVGQGKKRKHTGKKEEVINSQDTNEEATGCRQKMRKVAGVLEEVMNSQDTNKKDTGSKEKKRTATRGKAVGGQEKSKKKKRKRKSGESVGSAVSASIHIPNGDVTDTEDFNIRSAERTKVLTEFKAVLKDASVSPVVWAGCQIGDIKNVKMIVAVARVNRRLVQMQERPLFSVPLKCKLLEFLDYINVLFNYVYAYNKQGPSDSKIHCLNQHGQSQRGEDRIQTDKHGWRGPRRLEVL